jgi:hypothetical protein
MTSKGNRSAKAIKESKGSKLLSPFTINWKSLATER